MQVFAKCGVIKEDDERRPRIKVYRDKESGMPKGDGLVTYLKDPSVHMLPPPPLLLDGFCCVVTAMITTHSSTGVRHVWYNSVLSTACVECFPSMLLCIAPVLTLLALLSYSVCCF